MFAWLSSEISVCTPLYMYLCMYVHVCCTGATPPLPTCVGVRKGRMAQIVEKYIWFWNASKTR